MAAVYGGVLFSPYGTWLPAGYGPTFGQAGVFPFLNAFGANVRPAALASIDRRPAAAHEQCGSPGQARKLVAIGDRHMRAALDVPASSRAPSTPTGEQRGSLPICRRSMSAKPSPRWPCTAMRRPRGRSPCSRPSIHGLPTISTPAAARCSPRSGLSRAGAAPPAAPPSLDRRPLGRTPGPGARCDCAAAPVRCRGRGGEVAAARQGAVRGYSRGIMPASSAFGPRRHSCQRIDRSTPCSAAANSMPCGGRPSRKARR